jgi:hypothetical protein
MRDLSVMALLLALLAGFTPCVADSPAAYQGGDDSAVIYVARRGWHMDIGFAAADLQPPLKSVAAQFADVHYVFFGFGDEHYLKAKNHTTPTMLAALWPGPGLILATGLSSTPQEAFGIPNVIALAVTSRQSSDAQMFVWRSLHIQDEANPAYATGPYPGSLYFAATPTYSALHTCNTWAAESLAAAALPIDSAGVLFAGQLWRQARRLKRYRQGGLDPSWQTTVVDDP